MSDMVESELIRRYKPKYNKAKKSWNILRTWMNVGTNEYIKTT